MASMTFKDWIFSVYLYGFPPLPSRIYLLPLNSFIFVLCFNHHQHTDIFNICVCKQRDNPDVTLTHWIFSSGCWLGVSLPLEDLPKLNLKCNCPNRSSSYFLFHLVASIPSPKQNIEISSIFSFNPFFYIHPIHSLHDSRLESIIFISTAVFLAFVIFSWILKITS